MARGETAPVPYATVTDVVVTDIRRRRDGSAEVLSATFVAGGDSREIWFRGIDVAMDAGRADAFLPAALVPAMRLGTRLRIDGVVSPRLLRATDRVQEILHAWFPELRIVAVEAASQAPADAGAIGGRTLAFFTGGVDSSYTVLKHRQAIDDLVFVHGFDVPLADTDLRRRVRDRLRDAAAALGKGWVEVETNVRDATADLAQWQGQYHGAAIAAVALAIAPHYATALIASTRPYRNLTPMGSHYLLDPLWSTEALEFVHDGCEADRFRKVLALAESDVALRWLRVCWQNPDGQYNCGVCSKCVRTMVYLRAAGALDRCPTFAQPLVLRRALGMSLGPGRRYDVEQAYEYAAARGDDPELVRTLRRLLRQRPRPQWVRAIRGTVAAAMARKER